MAQLVLVLLLLVLAPLQTTLAIWFPWYFHRYGMEPHSSRHGGPIKVTPKQATMKTTSTATTTTTSTMTTPTPTATTTLTPTGLAKPNKPSTGVCPPGYQLKDKDTATCPPGYQLKRMGGPSMCDDNPLVMQLARLYVVSPERIVLLLAQPMLEESCEEISDVLGHIESFTSNCIMANDNIYGKLTEGLQFYKSEVCDGENRKRQASLSDAHSCLKELRTDMIECEAPADWYEKRNATKVCQAFNDILDCYYTRTGLLCGLEAAEQLRSFAGDIMSRAMLYSCEVNKRLPRIPDPMPAFYSSARSTSSNTIFAWVCLCVCWGLHS